MKCPKCHQELIKGEDQRFETLSDHVSDPNNHNHPLRPTFICNNSECPASKEELFWDEYGEMYGWERTFKFDNNIYSAYPSFARRMDIEIYKKGLKSQLLLHPCLMLWFLQPMIEFTYKSDDYGNVLKRGYKLVWLKKDHWQPWVKDQWGYHNHYSFPIMMIIKHIKRNISIIKDCSETYKQHAVKELLKPLPNWDKRWWRKVEKWADKNIFYKYYVKK